MTAKPGLLLDQRVHAPVRLAALTVLSAAIEVDFSHLKSVTGASDGNLSTHLSHLEKHGFLTVKRTFAGKRPRTLYRITPEGRKALTTYLDNLQRIVELSAGAVAAPEDSS